VDGGAWEGGGNQVNGNGAMAYQVEHYLTNPARCPYLKDRQWRLESRILLEVTAAELELLLERGWRRFGPEYFRPACRGCRECVSLRLPVEDFQPSKSQRRAFNRLRRMSLEVGVPEANMERLRLYHRWHRERERAHLWEPSPLSMEHYALQFCFPHACAREVVYRDGEKLVAVGILDVTETALSSVYFFYDPDYADISPGVGFASCIHGLPGGWLCVVIIQGSVSPERIIGEPSGVE